ncbi:cyclic nucleotide-binding domain protein (macronuclear) [Tetrahymena thermophila SB210]|uniref:Cyclic nucleotide-binding domain protein n=1 Tax=Tetrahymena thermophila (strain SB210) TaxID=312017 RepID=Q22HG9_TETTS|nr:cyclic nucleotide-binding domain protein [Tetrahymena thermophila SB210]EAR84732.2 cyclic nucleotide-binding domain protein [Tetrahymena thermophila SB210]|eukprot:XP_001032395.2 cyclic nucleotide-binding domain protein [Tetrahymena thermophila SB210]
MADKISNFFNSKYNDEEEDDELKLNQGYHVDDMLGYPSFIDKIRQRIEDNEQIIRPRRQTNQESLQSNRRNALKRYDYQQEQEQQTRKKQQTLINRKKVNSHDQKADKKGGILSKYKHLETKFLLDFMIKDDLYDLYQAINLQKKTEMLMILLKRSLSQLEIFKEIDQNLNPDIYASLIRSLKTLIVKQGSTIFSFGSVGKQYYFLIKGSVYILLRTGLGSKINSLEKVNHNQQNDKEHSEKKREIKILRKRDSLEGGGQAQQSVITTTQKKTKFITYANKLQSSDSKVFQDNQDNNSERDNTPSSKQYKLSWESPLKKQQSHFQKENIVTSSSNITDQQQDLKYLLQLQTHDKLYDDSRSQKSIEDKLSIAWSQDSQRNKEEIKKKFPHFQIVGTHQQGDGFGELSLLKGIKRTATIVAKEDCFFLTLDKDNYLKFLSEYHEKVYQEKISFVKQFFIFEQLDKRLPSLIILFEPKSYISGQCIYEPGDEVNYLYLIKKGTVAISRKIAQKSEKQLLKQVEYENSIASKYEREMQLQKSFIQQQQQQKQQNQRQSYSSKDNESEVMSKLDYIYENRKVENTLDTVWDGQQESDQSQGEEENIQDLVYSEEKGAFVGKNNKILSMMRSSPLKNRQSRLNSKSVSPKKNTILTVAGELCFFGEEEIVNGEKYRQYEARVTSSKVEILRISIKNLKIITKYNDVMQRIKAYYELKNEWRHAYVERSQNALLIQEYLAKNFKEQYTQNILNKDIQQKAAIQLTAKTIPHSMDSQKVTQSVLNRKLYIKSKTKQFKHKQSINSEIDQFDSESQKLLKKYSQNDLVNMSSRKIHFKNSDNNISEEEEENKVKNRNSSSPKKILIQNATADLSCKDFEQKVSFSFKKNRDEISNNIEQQKVQSQNQQSLERKYSKQNSMGNSIRKSQANSPQTAKKDSILENNLKSMLSQKENENENENESHKFIKICKIQQADSLIETLNTNQNEQSVEDLLTFQTQQKQIKQKQYSKKKSDEIQIHEFLDYNQNDQNQIKKVEDQNFYNSQRLQFKNTIEDSQLNQSPETKQMIQRQASKQHAEAKQKEQKSQNEIIQFQKEQENQMEKLRGILMKESRKSSVKKTKQVEKKQSNSQELDFREIHNIFINIEGIKSKKLDKYTKQYKEVKEKFSKEPKKKYEYIPKYGSEKAKEIVNQNKDKRNNSQYNSERKPSIINDTTMISRQRSNSISLGQSSQQRKFSFRQYLENQKTVSVESTSNHQIHTLNPDFIKTNQSVFETKQSEHIRKPSQALYDENQKIDAQNKQIVVQIHEKSNLRNQIGHQSQQNYQSDDLNVEILDKTQNYYFQKTPNRPQSHKHNKELDKIIEKDNSMILYQDQQDHHSETMIEECKRVEESDIDQVRNMLMLVKKLKIDHLMENKYTDQNISSGFMSKSLNIVSIPTTARSTSQKQRRKVSLASDKKDYHFNYDTTYSHGKSVTQEVSQFNNTCINFKDEQTNQSNQFSKKIYNLTEREQQKRKQSSGAIFRPTVPLQQFPLKSLQPTEKQSFQVHSRYQSFHHVRKTNQ